MLVFRLGSTTIWIHFNVVITVSFFQVLNKLQGACEEITVHSGRVTMNDWSCDASKSLWDGDAAKFGYACIECSTDGCNDRDPLPATLAATASATSSRCSVVMLWLLYVRVISLQ